MPNEMNHADLALKLAHLAFDLDNSLGTADMQVINQAAADERRIEKLESENIRLKETLKIYCGGELPVYCAECDKWGGAGWSQHQVGYCEGDNKPHKAADFCSYGERKDGEPHA